MENQGVTSLKVSGTFFQKASLTGCQRKSPGSCSLVGPMRIRTYRFGERWALWDGHDGGHGSRAVRSRPVPVVRRKVIVEGCLARLALAGVAAREASVAVREEEMHFREELTTPGSLRQPDESTRPKQLMTKPKDGVFFRPCTCHDVTHAF